MDDYHYNGGGGGQDSSDEAVSSDDEQERFGRRLPRTRYATIDDDDNDPGGMGSRGGKRSREEALYGVFMDDLVDHGPRGG